jgi:capsular polysaccharide transport system permease protein
MITKPKARRFKLRLGDDGGAALGPAVAPLRTEQGPQANLAAGVTAAATAPIAASEARAPGQVLAQAAARAAAPPAPRAAQSSLVQPTAAAPAQAPAVPSHAVPPAAAPPQAASPQSAPLQAAPPQAAPPQAAPRPAPPAQAAPIDAPPRPAQPAQPAQAAPAQPAPPQPAPRAAAVRLPEHAADVEGPASVEAEIEAIRAEQLTGRQLRLAQRVAQKNGIRAATGVDAVRLLRRQGIDPFKLDTILDMAGNGDGTLPVEGEPSRALTRTEQPALPKVQREGQTPAKAKPTLPSAEARAKDIKKIQRDIVRRRRRRLALLLTRLFVFVWLPTAIAGWYFYMVATPLYATNSEFVIQQADSAGGAAAPGLGSMLSGTGMATQQDSVTVQSFLQSREAMRRLDAEHGFKAYFQRDEIDPLRRLAIDATDEAAYRLYQRMVQISYDPTEGLIRMEVIAADPETSERFARALVAYAEEQVDQLTQRLRENQMRDAIDSVEIAEMRNREAQMRVLELQEQFQVLSGEVEVSLLTQQITTLEGQLNQERLSLADVRANARPNSARVAQVERRIGALESQIATLRGSLTQGSAGGQSVARAQRELVMAEADVATRQMLLAQSMQQMESARIEANRQVRYLSMGVSPIAPDEATYPRKFENTVLAFLIFAGVYLMLSMTASILREQVTG